MISRNFSYEESKREIMVKQRENQLPALEHEQRQLEALKRIIPNTTPEHYRALSDGLADVSITALDLIAALEANRRPDFGRLYSLVDSLANLVSASDNTEPDEQGTQAPAVALESTTQLTNGTLPSVMPTSAKQPIAGVTAMKTNVVGRPDKIDVQGDTVTLYLTYTPKPNTNGTYGFPKGVPTPPEVITPIIAYIGKKQFDKIKPQLDNPDDTLIIEGGASLVIDGVLTVYASNITSRLLQMAKNEQKKVAQASE